MTSLFRLFENDPVEKIFSLLHMGQDARNAYIKRCFFLVGLTWFPMAVLSSIEGIAVGPTYRQSFLFDLAAYSQMWIGLPLFIFAQKIIVNKIDRSVLYLKECIIAESDYAEFQHRIEAASAQIKSFPAFLIILTLSFLTPWTWLGEELSNGVSSWISLAENSTETLTLTGYWEAWAAMPLFFLFLWRWVWNILVWCRLLYRISRLELRLQPTHPDKAGGLYILSVVQSHFGIIIFAFGCVVMATVFHKILFEGVPVSSFSIWGLVIGFIFLAPVFFMLPLAVFTPRLVDVKIEGLLRYGKLAAQASRDFEQEKIDSQFDSAPESSGSTGSLSLEDIRNNYEIVRSLRIVPFDFRSLLRLFLAALGPMIPLLSKTLPFGNILDGLLNFLFGI